VVTKKPNELGIYDMSGNVWEWSQEWYDNYYYEINSDTNPYNHKTASTRALRGGSWFDLANYVRVVDRLNDIPDFTYNISVFRVCRTV
jgi:formylglycine-generating enzyme required for sulfatase activity